MRNLENYGVQELNMNELTELDGGFWKDLAKAVVYDVLKAGAIWVLKNGGGQRHHSWGGGGL